MTYYDTRHLAESFRTVRRNTLIIAREIPADQYDFSPAPGVRTVSQLLAHLAVATRWNLQLHRERVTFITFERFAAALSRNAAEEALLQTKDEIIAALERDGDEFAAFIDSMDEALLAEEIGFPPGVQPPVKSRFELVLGVKEHEMHHRAQLMLIQRLLGIVPHLTRQREAMAAQAGGGKA